MADTSRIKAIKIGLASPEDIEKWSFGEVKKPETINYRTFKPERDGLFCERIFGPTHDWECACGRYKRVKNKGIRCERCGVEVTRARVRRERMGHIQLCAPVCHVWYLKGQPPSPLALLLDLPAKQIEKVVYFTNYIVIDIDRAGIEQILGDLQRFLEEEKQNFELEIERKCQELDARLELELQRLKDELTEQQIAERVRLNENRKEGEQRELAARLAEMEKAIETLAKLQQYQLIDEATWQGVETLLLVASRRFQRDLRPLVRVGQGAGAIEELLKNIDLEKLSRELKEEFSKTAGQRRARVIKRLEMVEAFRNSKTRPEWMILNVVPVLPPELRPMVQLDGGRFATSDLNDLYRRIVNRNNRLRRIVEIRAPKTIANSEKRLLQEAVDSLIDNSRRSKPVTGTGGRPLKSLSDMLKGKEGRFRKNLLGKRVDYSGRSVIVVGPHLKLHQCGLPKEMALELFKPFVMHRLIHGPEQVASNVKNAKVAIDRQIPEVWKALETVIKEHPVLLNRAPTLHRLGIQAFEPILVEGKAIQLHPLVCHAYNADFDGDQMAVHVPLSYQAQAEARTLMLSVHNLFKPADGSPVVSPLQDIVLGAYYLTMNDPLGEKEPVETFANFETSLHALEQKYIRLHQPIRVYLTPAEAETLQLVTTTAGRLIFHSIMPNELRYHPEWLNTVFNKKQLSAIIREVYNICGHMRTVQFLDDLKALGFEWALRGGITFAVTDLKTPSKRDEILRKADAEAQQLDKLYDAGELTYQEKRQRLTELWQRTYEEIAKAMQAEIEADNPLFIITDSGARGSYKQLAQLVGMRGLMMGGFDIRSGGERLIEELPVRRNFQEGLTSQEYFVSGYGARRGLASTALLTSSAGYLTRRMCDVAQDVIVRKRDCETTDGIVVARIIREGELIEPLYQRIRGRTALYTIRHPYTGKLLAEENTLISESTAQTIDTLAQRVEEFLHTVRELHNHNKEEGELFMPQDDQPLTDPRTGEVLLEPFEPIDPETVQRLDARATALKQLWLEAGFEWAEHERVGVPIRSPLACSARQGVCALCYGLDMGTLKPVELGTAVGIIAAESIGEPGTQLTMRVFHTGGAAGAGQQIAQYRADLGFDAAAVFLGTLEARGVGDEDIESELILDSRTVLLQTASKLLNRPIPKADTSDTEKEEQRRERQFKEALRRLAKLNEQRATGINRVDDLFEARKPKGEALIAGYEGEVVDIVRTRIQRWVVIRAELPVGEQLIGKMSLEDIPEPDVGKPMGNISIQDTSEPDVEALSLSKALALDEGSISPPAKEPDSEAQLAQKDAETPRTASVPSPRKEKFLLQAMEEIRPAHIDRLIKAGIDKVEVLDALPVPTFGELEVKKGDTVQPGDRITPGPLNPHELLRLRGVRGAQEYLIQEIQAVYKAQGVDIDDKHIEVIIRQMLRKRKVIDPGDTYFLPGQTVDRFVFEETNAKVVAEGGRPATAEWVLLGVSESAHQTESFLSSASFQRTQKMLTEAAVRGKIDELVGLKENVIIGRLIPAGTGFVNPQFTPRFERVADQEPTPIAVKPVETEPTLGTLFQEELKEPTDGEALPSSQDGHEEPPIKPKRSRKKKAE